jgi:predicted AlkP superfamily pyrophosphatase or phosphodiesterase
VQKVHDTELDICWIARSTADWYIVVYDESIDYNDTLLFSGGIDPAKLPKTIKKGKCVEVYPHSRLRVNTVFEVVKSKGHVTAYTDKHPAYDLVRGPSGSGLSEGYFPEIAAVTTDVPSTITYDQLHVNAFLDWIDGKSPAHAEGSISKMPTLFGGNFQAVSVGQKTKGYNKDLSFTPALLKAIDFVDTSLGKVVSKLKSKGVLDDTLIIVASKHGQAPINPALYNKVDPKVVTNATGVDVSFQTVRVYPLALEIAMLTNHLLV